MPTLIDSLIIELGLDPTKFEEGQKKAAAGLVKTKDAATKAGKEIEEGNKKAAESFGAVKSEALSLLAVFIGGAGVKAFLSDVSKVAAETGRMGTMLGQPSQNLSAFGMAVERFGGSSRNAVGNISQLTDMLEGLKAEGKMPPQSMFMMFQNAGMNFDMQKDAVSQTYEIATALQKIFQNNPVRAGYWARQLGLDPGTYQLMVKMGPGLRTYVDNLKRLAPSDRDVQVSQDFWSAWAGTGQEVSFLGTKIASDLLPPLTALLKDIEPVIHSMGEWAEKNPEVVKGIAALVALLTAAGVAKSIANVLALAGALRGLAGATAAAEAAGAAATTGGLAGLLAMAGRFGLLGAAGYALYETVRPQPAGDGEDEAARQRRFGQGNLARGMIGLRSASGGIAARDAAALIRKVGGTEQEAVMLGAIAAGESGGNARAHNANAATGDNSYGLWQINMIGGLERERLAKYGLKDKTDLYDPETNARVALAMARAAGGYRDWSVFKSGAYLPYVNAARDGATGAARTTRDAVLPPMPSVNVPAYSAATAADAAATTNNDNRSYRPMTVHVGGVNVHAPGADANGVANGIDRALTDSLYISQLDSGPQ